MLSDGPGPIGVHFAVLNVVDWSNTNFVAAATYTVQFHSYCKQQNGCLYVSSAVPMLSLAVQKTLISKLDEG